MDMDDGVYLPLEEMQEQPVISKEVFFAIVDQALKKLADGEGWKFKEKPYCARLEVSDRFHLDFPLYAVPYDRYSELLAKCAFEDFRSEERDDRRRLPDGCVHMAARNSPHWIKSDPLLVINWFEGATCTQGEILRRVCRYLKAWRDYHFHSGGPSSITLMACAEETMKNRGFTDDSAALLACAKALASQLERGVKSPIDDTEPPVG